MSMFQPQNYGADFINGMAATSGMVNDRRKLDMAEKREAEDEKTRAIQRDTAVLENQQKSQALERDKALNGFLDLRKRLEAGALKPEDYPALAGTTEKVMEFTPYLPTNVAEAPKYKQALSTLIQGVESIRTLPVSNYRYTREDNVPEINATLDAYQTMAGQDRFGKQFTDPDGSITGKPGTAYKTTGVGGFVMASGEGNKAAFTPLFAVADAEGKPILGADGKQVMVPATVNGSNDPNDKVRQITPEEMLTKAGFAYKVLDTADKLGLADPEKRKEWTAQTLPNYMGEKGAEKVLESSLKKKALHAYAPDQNVYNEDGKLVQAATQKEKYMTVAEGGKIVNTATGETIAEGAPKQVKAPPTVKAGAGGGMVQELAFNEKTGNYDIPVGKPYPAHAPKEGKGEDGASKQAKVGVLNNVKAAMLRRYVPVAQNELRRRGGKDEELEPTLDDKALGLPANPAGVYSALGETGRKVYDRAMVLAEQYASKGQNPETAVTNALAQASKEHGLDSQGRVQARQAPAPKPQAKAPQKKQQVAKNDTRPPLSAFNKGR